MEKYWRFQSDVTPAGRSSYDQNGRCSIRSGLPMVSRKRFSPAPCTGSTSWRMA